MAALLRGEKSEIPVRVEATVEFVSPGVGDGLVGDALSAVRDFLRLRNLLAVYDPKVVAEQRVRLHVEEIERMAGYLDRMIECDSRCAPRLRITDPHQAAAADSYSQNSRLPYTVELLRELRARGEWVFVEQIARRFTTSDDPTLAEEAERAIIEALMHSDEMPKRTEAAARSRAALQSPTVSAEDFLLACGAHEVVGDDLRTRDLLIDALARWPNLPKLVSYARSFAPRAGDAAIRASFGDVSHGGAGA